MDSVVIGVGVGGRGFFLKVGLDVPQMNLTVVARAHKLALATEVPRQARSNTTQTNASKLRLPDQHILFPGCTHAGEKVA
eukprot:1324026-Amorphochlora_amoeboformis.AAC.1